MVIRSSLRLAVIGEGEKVEKFEEECALLPFIVSFSSFPPLHCVSGCKAILASVSNLFSKYFIESGGEEAHSGRIKICEPN